MTGAQYNRWREGRFVYECFPRRRFALPESEARLRNINNDDGRFYLFVTGDLWDQEMGLWSHIVRTMTSVPANSVALGNNNFWVCSVPRGCVKHYFLASHSVYPQAISSEEQAIGLGGPDGWFDPKELMHGGRYALCVERLRAVCLLMRYDGPVTGWTHKKGEHFRTLIRHIKGWGKDDRAKHLWSRDGSTGKWFLRMPINGFGMMDIDIFASFFCDMTGSHVPSGGMSNNEFFLAPVFFRPNASPANLAERAEGPKHRFGFVIEALASTENGNFATGALDVRPDMLRRVSSTGECNNAAHEVPPGFFRPGSLSAYTLRLPAPSRSSRRPATGCACLRGTFPTRTVQ